MISKKIKNLLSRAFTKDNSSNIPSEPLIIQRSEHTVSRSNISSEALKVLYRLNENGYEAYLVGGAVRDLLLGSTPKDFDVATNATPEQVRALFKNSRLIGRRFRLAHVFFGRTIIEVATFRAPPNEEQQDDRSHVKDGRILRDNVYGTLEQDAFRRDFTINALYYNIADYSIVDYTGGVADLDNRIIRLIGDPDKRYHEDPVRMLRAIRFAAKFDMTIEDRSIDALHQYYSLLDNASSARLFDEMVKLFHGGAALQTMHTLRDYRLLKRFFPVTVDMLDSELDTSLELSFIEAALNNTDERINRGKTTNPAFLIAVMLWPALMQELNKDEYQSMPPVPAFQQAGYEVLKQSSAYIGVPKRLTLMVREIWSLQPRLIQRRPNKLQQLLSHPRFRAAYDFLYLRAKAGETEMQPLADWWTSFQEADADQKKAMIPKQKRRRTRKKKTPKND